MKLTVTVTFGKNEQTFDIPVGDGQKTVKWLATVASQRFSARAPHGRLRAREPLMAQPQASAYMPSSVTTADSSFFHPEAMLAEKMHDGQKVTVALAPRIPVDEIGHTMLSRWAVIAFATSDAQRGLREAALKEEYVIQEAQQRAREQREAADRLREQTTKATEFREVIASQLHSEEKIEEALMEDWYNMNKRSMIDTWLRSPVEQGKVRSLFHDHYVQLSELFKTYGAAGAAMGTTHEMEYNEFTQARENGARARSLAVLPRDDRNGARALSLSALSFVGRSLVLQRRGHLQRRQERTGDDDGRVRTRQLLPRGGRGARGDGPQPRSAGLLQRADPGRDHEVCR